MSRPVGGRLWRKPHRKFILIGMNVPPPPQPCRILSAIGAVWLLAGCAAPQPPTPQQQAALAACQAQAEQQFQIQYRSNLYQPDTSLTPYATTAPQSAQIQSLANQYSQRQMVQDCLRGASGPAPIAPSAPAPLPPPAP